MRRGLGGYLAGSSRLRRELPPCLLGLPMKAVPIRLVEPSVDGRAEPAEMMLGDAVLRSRSHRIDRPYLGHGARDDDEREVRGKAAEHAERGDRVEVRQRVLRDAEVERVGLERGRERELLFDPRRGQLIAVCCQRTKHERGVGLVVIDDQDSNQRRATRCGRSL